EGDLKSIKRERKIPEKMLEGGGWIACDHFGEAGKPLAENALHERITFQPRTERPVRMTLRMAERIDLAHVEAVLHVHFGQRRRVLDVRPPVEKSAQPGNQDDRH